MTRHSKHSPQDDYRQSINDMPDNDFADCFSYIDDEILVLDKTPSRTESIYWVLGLSIGLAYFIWGLSSFRYQSLLPTSKEPIEIIAAIMVMAIIAAFFVASLVILYHIAFYIYRGKRKITFHRLTGMIEAPKPLFRGWNGATFMFPFTDRCVKYIYHGSSAFYISYPGRCIGYFLLSTDRTGKEMSFYRWYMDRNRQLPPGKRLNPYRIKDFLRREAEGFPKPLRYASIKIPSRKIVPSALKKERERIKLEEM